MAVKSTTMIVVAGLLGLAGGGTVQAQVDAGTVETTDCQGKSPLFDVATVAQPAFGAGNMLSYLRAIPVAFASSGDQCLGPIPIYRISSHEDAARNTHSMARRLAPLMQEYSKRTGLEACARMCRTDAGTIVAQLVTIQSHISCLAPNETCPGGSLPTAETIHSHPPHRVFQANAVDALGWDDPTIDGELTWTGNPDSLSPQDRQQAPVWMVGTRGQLVWLGAKHGKEIEKP